MLLATTPPGFAFANLNLRFNPFGELTTELRARVAVVDPIDVTPAIILQVIGEAGRGKSTLLHALHARMPGAHYEYIPEGANRYLSTEFPEAGFLLDEAQRVKPRLLRRLDRIAHRLVIASHEDLSHLFRRPVNTIVVSGLDVGRLAQIVERRIELARRDAGPVPRIAPSQLERLIARFDDDLRAIEAHLYVVFQALDTVSDVEV